MNSISTWVSCVQPGSPISPDLKDFIPDLTAFGYTSLFIPHPISPIKQQQQQQQQHIPKRFKSLSNLRRKRSTQMPALTPKQPLTPTAVTKRKKAKYPSHAPPLANELALMQFADGGNIDSHIKRLMDAHASAAAGSRPPAGVPGVYRDPSGTVWWDQDEEWEYAHLLPLDKPPTTAATADRDWVRFPADTDDRRGSVSTQASSIDPRHLVRPMDEDAFAAFGSALPPRALRSRRLHPHHTQQQQQPRPEFLHAFTPRDAAHATAAANPVLPTSKSKTRRRPAPLDLAPPSGGGGGGARRTRPYSPVDADKVRRDFIAGSFAPVPPVPPMPPVPTAATNAGKARTRGMTLAGLFKRRE